MQRTDNIIQPACSICIANYNGANVILDCLNSIKSQYFIHPIEIIIHDDASSDNSIELISQHFPEALLIKSKENVGFCISNNRMAEKATGKYLLILNNDTRLHPDAIQTFYENAEMSKAPAILGIRQFNAASGELIDFGIILDPFMNSIPNKSVLKINNVAMIMGACMWIPKILWNEIVGFPEWFHTMHEDMYICCMARLLGYSVKVIPQSGYDHWVGTSLGGGKVVKNRLSTSIKRRALSERNRLYVMALCYPSPFIWITLPLHIVLLIIEGILLSVVKQEPKIFSSIYLSALRSFWRNRIKIVDLRYTIQKKRKINIKIFFSTFSIIPQKIKMLIKHGVPKILSI